MKLAGKTDVGRVRQENQDDYRAGELPGGAVWALVCDGMGGAKGGREASQGACNVIEQVFQEQYAQCGAGQEGAFLKKALISANRYVFNKAAHEESLAGMGTTAVCALVRGGEATLCHAGDSRAYLCRGGKLTQLTHDHSYVQELVDCGTITEEEAEHHPQKNIITKALGVDYRLEPEVTSVQLQAKDLLLLCSDGLTNMVPVEQMEQLLAQGPFYDLPDRLVDAANENGGSDNITALLLAVAAAVVVLLAVGQALEEVTGFLTELGERTGVSPELFVPLYKAVGIALVVRVGSSLCRDAGESALASVVETAGAVCALVVSLPLLRTVLSLLLELME